MLWNIKMLEKFNKLYNNIIKESTDFQQNFMQQINNCDAFFRAYLQPLNQKKEILIEKRRYNVFSVSGTSKDLFNFLKKFKVDKQFCKDINGNQFVFQIYQPLICTRDIRHYYNNDIDEYFFDRTHSEGYELMNAGQRVPTDNQMNDIGMRKIQGKWFKLFDNTQTNEAVPDFYVNKEIHACQPKQLVAIIKKFIKSFNIPDDYILQLEFMVNSDKLPNNSFGQAAKQVSITFSGINNKVLDVADKMNDTDKMIAPTATCIMPKSTQTPVVNETKKVLKKTKKNNFDKSKTKKVK